jgi:lysophospholipase L1-like esterase
MRRSIFQLARTTGLGVIVVAASALALAPKAGAATAVSEFYLALGASESVGVQPTALVPHGVRTSHGYANDLVMLAAARGVSMSLTRLGCPGESTATMLQGGDRCTPGTTQLSRALTFLQNHQQSRGVVTIDLGFNDLHPCVATPDFSPSCVTDQLNLVATQLPLIIGALKGVAGPNVTFVGLNHNNPYAAAGIALHASDTYVDNSITAFARLNDLLGRIYAAQGVPVADVAKTFANGDGTPTVVAGYGTIPLRAARECALTWICASAPYRPNLHANDAGYWAIARTIDAILG